MQIDHPLEDLNDVQADLRRRDNTHFYAWMQVSVVLTRYWKERYTYPEFLVLTFVLGRTLLYRKRAESIVRAHFTTGVRGRDGEMVCAPCGLGESALNTALKSLTEKDILNVHCFKLPSGVERTSRIYEVNVEKILSGYDPQEVYRMLHRGQNEVGGWDDFELENSTDNAEIDETPPPQKRKIARKEAEIEENEGGAWHRGGGLPNRGQSPLLRKGYKTLLRKVPATDAPASSGPKLRVSRKRLARTTQPVEDVAIDCTESPTQSSKEKLEAILARSAERRKARAESARKRTTGKWSTKELQALLDEARSRAGTNAPRIVATAKGIGTLYQRLVAAEVEDVTDFFAWAIRNWNMVANANRRAKARTMRQTRESTSEMSLVPNFQDLAYRCPYILTFYNERQYVAAQEEEKRTEERARSDRARRNAEEIAAARKQQAAKADRERDDRSRRIDDMLKERLAKSRSTRT